MQTSYVIFTDSTGDLTPALIEQCELQVMPMAFNLDGADYRNYPDGREMSPHEFYEKLRGGSLCKTSQIPISEFVDAFTPVLEQGLDILYLAFSSGLSGHVPVQPPGRGGAEGKIPRPPHDLRRFAAGQHGRRAVCVSCRAKAPAGRGAGRSGPLCQRPGPVCLRLVHGDDLMFLKRGGRVSGAVAVAGTLLGIKPVLHVDDEGHLIAMGKGARPPRQPGRAGAPL